MIKVMVFLTKRDDLSREQFRAHNRFHPWVCRRVLRVYCGRTGSIGTGCSTGLASGGGSFARHRPTRCRGRCH